MRTAVIGIIFLAIALATGVMVSHYTPVTMLLLIAAAAVFTATFINTEWGLYILIFSMLLSPEFIAGDTAGASMNRGVTLRLEDVLLVLIGFSWFARNAVLKDLGLFLKTPLNLPIGLYMLACTLSTGFGVMAGRVEIKTGALYVLKYFEYFIVYFMLVNHLQDRRQVRRFVTCLFLTAFIVAVIGIMQIPGGTRVTAPFEGRMGEPNTFGGYLLFIGMVVAGLATRAKDKKKRHLLVVLLICLTAPFFFTQSRTSYVAAVPACLALGFMAERRLIIVGLVSIALLVSPLFLPAIVKQRIMYTFNQPQEPGQIMIGGVRLDTSTSARLESWQSALRDFPEHPFLGYGVSGYRFLDAQIPRVLAETGLLGLSAFFYLLYSVLMMAVRRLRTATDPYDKGLIAGFLSGYIGLLVHSLGINTFIIVRIMEPFWFFAGIVAVLPLLGHEPEEAAAAPVERTAVAPIRRTRLPVPLRMD